MEISHLEIFLPLYYKYLECRDYDLCILYLQHLLSGGVRRGRRTNFQSNTYYAPDIVSEALEMFSI